MAKIASLLAVSATALLISSQAYAAWDRGSVWDPAFDSSIDRQLEANGKGVTAGTAIATNDAAPAQVGPRHYFGANLDRAVESQDNPHDN